jgi:two-component system LytT family sensor kinase
MSRIAKLHAILQAAGFDIRNYYKTSKINTLLIETNKTNIMKQRNSEQQLQSTLREGQLKSQLQILNYQINPHFLFNSLNNLYAIADRTGEELLSRSIAKLVEIMRYILYENSKPFVPLSRELMYLQDYIELVQLKYDPMEPVSITFQVKGEVLGVGIAPMVLITFVENAFKHGLRPSQTSEVRMCIEIKDQRIQMTIKNTLFQKRKSNLIARDPSIGLENVKARLELIYKDRYHLNIKEEGGYYTVELILPKHDY